jgi:hypothetical protein
MLTAYKNKKSRAEQSSHNSTSSVFSQAAKNELEQQVEPLTSDTPKWPYADPTQYLLPKALGAAILLVVALAVAAVLYPFTNDAITIFLWLGVMVTLSLLLPAIWRWAKKHWNPCMVFTVLAVILAFLLGMLFATGLSSWQPREDNPTPSSHGGKSSGSGSNGASCELQLTSFHNMVQTALNNMKVRQPQQTDAEKTKLLSGHLCSQLALAHSFKGNGVNGRASSSFPEFEALNVSVDGTVCKANDIILNKTLPVVHTTAAADRSAEHHVIAKDVQHTHLLIEKIKAAVDPTSEWYNGLIQLISDGQMSPNLAEFISNIEKDQSLIKMLKTLAEWNDYETSYQQDSKALWWQDFKQDIVPSSLVYGVTFSAWALLPGPVTGAILSMETVGGALFVVGAHLEAEINPLWKWRQNFGLVEHHYAAEIENGERKSFKAIEQGYLLALGQIDTYFKTNQPKVHKLLNLVTSYTEAIRTLEGYATPTLEQLQNIFQEVPLPEPSLDKELRNDARVAISQSIQETHPSHELEFLVRANYCINRSMYNKTDPCRNDIRPVDVQNFWANTVDNTIEDESHIPVMLAIKPLIKAIHKLFDDFTENIASKLVLPKSIVPPQKSHVHEMIIKRITKAKATLTRFDKQSGKFLNAMTKTVQQHAIFSLLGDPRQMNLNADEIHNHYALLKGIHVHRDDGGELMDTNMTAEWQRGRLNYFQAQNITDTIYSTSYINPNDAIRWSKDMVGRLESIK